MPHPRQQTDRSPIHRGMAKKQPIYRSLEDLIGKFLVGGDTAKQGDQAKTDGSE